MGEEKGRGVRRRRQPVTITVVRSETEHADLDEVARVLARLVLRRAEAPPAGPDPAGRSELDRGPLESGRA